MKIGNNVFIGMHTTILKGVHIGNNVIIGANSLVNKDIPDKCVVAGNPVKVIMSIEDYYRKRKEEQLKEATELVQLYRKKYGKEPDDRALHEFFWLFCDEKSELPECWDKVMKLVGNEDKTKDVFAEHKKMFNNKKEFFDSIN